MYKVLIDTCVWLDMAKDYQQQATLAALNDLILQGEIELILPRTIIDEFARNKERVIEQSSRSISSTLKRVKDVVEKFGDPQQKNVVISQLNDVDHRLPLIGEAAIETVSWIDKIFNKSSIIEISDSVKIRAAQRAIENRAPFHRQRNGIGDSILIEVYSDLINEEDASGSKFAFISHNTSDFSHLTASKKLPHPDIENCFAISKSYYFISLSEALQHIQPEHIEELSDEYYWNEEPRRLTEIIKEIDELVTKVWYNRHQIRREKIEAGLILIVEKEDFPIKNHATRPIQRNIWEGALEAAAKVEERFGLENLGPWNDFEWGMINGKLSALRWILGDEWDMLDT